MNVYFFQVAPTIVLFFIIDLSLVTILSYIEVHVCNFSYSVSSPTGGRMIYMLFSEHDEQLQE